MEVNELYIDIPGGNVFVKHWRPLVRNSEVPIILLHDSIGCVAAWKDFPRKLSEKCGREVIAFDRLGYGQSSARTEPATVNFIDDEAEFYLPVITRTLGISNYSLFGYSVGGAIALVHAREFIHSCISVVIESAQAFVEDRTLEGILKSKADFENPALFAKLEKYHGLKTQWVLDAWIKTWTSAEFAPWSLKNDLPLVTCPVLVLHGDRDEYGSNKFPEMIKELSGGTTEMHIIPDCGHVPHKEKSELVLNLVSDFFDKY